MTSASLTPTLADLWREARAWLAAALADFGGPARIAATFAAAARAAMRRRLALLEALVMKLLLIEAASHPFPHPFPGRRAAASPGPIDTAVGTRCAALAVRRDCADGVMGPGLRAVRASGNGWEENPADPTTWRVRFRLRIPRPRAAPITHAPLQLRPRPEPIRAAAHARALARRFEALRRVLADPRRAIAALARRLAHLGHAARAVARAIALARGPRGESPGPALAAAMVFSHDASFGLPGDTS